MDTAGISYVRTLIRDPQRPPTPGEARDEGWIRIRQDGQVTDTLAIPAEDPIGGGFELAGKGGSYRPFTVMTVNVISPHGYLVTCRNDEYSLLRPLRDGRTLRIERDSEPIRVRPEEKRQWNAWVERFQRRSQQQGRQGSYGPIPDVKPFVRHLFVDDDARIWVAVYAEARFTPYSEAERAERGDRPSLEWNQPLVWEVFHPRGQFLGRVTLPDKTSLLAARGTTVWGSQSGAYDEDYVVRFRIRKGAMSTNPDG